MPGFTGTKVVSNTALDQNKNATIAAVTGGGILVWTIVLFNPDATNATFVQFFDATSANVTVGSTAPTFVIPLGPKGGCYLTCTNPLEFRNALTTACTATATGNGAPSTAAVMTIGYTPA